MTDYQTTYLLTTSALHTTASSHVLQLSENISFVEPTALVHALFTFFLLLLIVLMEFHILSLKTSVLALSQKLSMVPRSSKVKYVF